MLFSNDIAAPEITHLIVMSKFSALKGSFKFKVGRYHSLKLKEPFYAENFDITMRCVISGAAMRSEEHTSELQSR